MAMNKILIVGDKTLNNKDTGQSFFSNVALETDFAWNYEAGLHTFEAKIPDLIICDLRLGKKHSGIDLVKKTRNIKKVPVIYTANKNDNEYLNKALTTYPDAFLIRPFSTKQLLITIKRVLHQLNVDKKTDTTDIKNPNSGNDECLNFPRPSVRELEVIHHIAKGDTTKLIADKLCISYTTVQTHRKNLLNKYKARSCAELVNIACQNNWINLAV
jgi:DNA-binding NarL/FixJ family response regulator